MSKREKVGLWVEAIVAAVAADFIVGWAQGEGPRQVLVRDVCSLLLAVALWGAGFSVWAVWCVWQEVRAESTHYTD